MQKIVGIFIVVLLFAGCQNSEEDSGEPNTEPVEENSTDENEDTILEDNNGTENDNNENTDEDASNQSEENNSDDYTDVEENPSYSIGTQYIEGEVDGNIQFYTALSINRDDNQQRSREQQIENSLNESDPSQRGILSTYADISIDGPELQLNFSGEGSDLSTSSTQSLLFFDSLIGISDLYGVEEVLFLNSDGENDIIVAERKVDEPLNVNEERGLTRGYYTVYDEDSEETLFLAGGALEEQVENEDGEPLTFSETIETMATVGREDAFYSSAIVEGLEVLDASMDDQVATVEYSMDEATTSEADRIVFERAIQLTALDFDAESVRLVNDSMQEVTSYPLIAQ